MEVAEQRPLRTHETRKAIRSFRELLESCKQSFSEDKIALIERAFKFSYRAYYGMRRYTGESYIFHPIEVAKIVYHEIGLGHVSIIAALLHDVMTYGNISKINLEKEFNGQITSIVEGLTKISGLDTRTKSLQAENYRKLLLTMVSDVRVILIKLADRLHNMRNIGEIEPARQHNMAMETSYLYAPLAHRIGLYRIKSELEDLAMKYIDPETYSIINQKLENTKIQRKEYIQKFIAPIQEKLATEGINFEIKQRTKSIASIWNKMKNKNIDFEDIYDIFAVRIILNSPEYREKEYCWRVYSIVTDIYQPNPQRLRDWISIPKSNGYESLHITVMGPEKKWIEVQIRTWRMNEVAEKGLAAHWRYKGVKTGGSKTLDELITKVRDLLENNDLNPVEFIDNIKLNLYKEEIFVFTPKGDLKKLPIHATVLDFAYDIHTEIGNHCIGARINDKNVSIKQELHNGDQVEVITSKNQKPKEEWLNYVVTTKAKSKIKVALKEQHYQEANIGKELLKRRFKNWKITHNDDIINRLIRYYKYKSATDFYRDIAREEIDMSEIKNRLQHGLDNANGEIHLQGPNIAESREIEEESQVLPQVRDMLIIEDSINNIGYSLAKCCNPVFGDKIFGYVTVGEGIKIHRYSCPNAERLLTKYPYRVVNARWRMVSKYAAFQTKVKVTGTGKPGLLGNITDIISKDKQLNMRSIVLNFDDELFEGVFTILVQSKDHLDSLMQRLLKIKGITKVVRLHE